MSAVRALQKRASRLEHAAKPRPSPLVRWFGSFEVFVKIAILPGIEGGALAEADMIDVVAALRRWEADGTWDRAHAR